MGQYFIQDKIVHKHPAECEKKYNGEKIYGTPPLNYKKCKKCFGLAIEKPHVIREK